MTAESSDSLREDNRVGINELNDEDDDNNDEEKKKKETLSHMKYLVT